MDKSQIYKILGEAYFSENPHEKELLIDFEKMLIGAALFVDIGASLGQFTKLANRVMRNGEIIAVEADPVRFEELERNCAQWAKESGNKIRAVHAAISDRNGTIVFQTTNSNVSGGLVRHAVNNAGEGVTWSEVRVPSLTIDELCSKQNPTLIKMDIEGGELAALKGAQKCLAARKSRLVVEIHTFAELGGLRYYNEVIAFMKEHGYESLPLHDKTLFAAKGTFGMVETLRLRSSNLIRRVRNRLA